MRRHRAAPQEELIAALNPVIRGWSAYHRTVVAKETFSRCDHLLLGMLWRWATRRHPHKARGWVRTRYWRTSGARRWVFATATGARLPLHAATPITRPVKVRGTASPYDGNLLYGGQRIQHHPLTGSALARALKRQGWRCASCGLTFRDDDLIELDHIVPTAASGPHDGLNHQALQRHCHDTTPKRAVTGLMPPTDARYPVTRDHSTEEPGSGKLLCPVLETNGTGDLVVEFKHHRKHGGASSAARSPHGQRLPVAHPRPSAGRASRSLERDG
jgi:RNA-directed DNA polymerase